MKEVKIFHLSPHNIFTEREGEIIEPLVNGLKFNEIAEELKISSNTVKTRIFGKEQNLVVNENGEEISFDRNSIKGKVSQRTGKPIRTSIDLLLTLVAGHVVFLRSERELKERKLQRLVTPEGPILVYR